MKAQELRVLNNVLDIEGKVCQVMRVHAKGVVGLSAVDGSYKWESFSLQDDVKPIPLTEEWLLKFGFDKCLNGFWCPKELLNVKISKFSVTQIFLSGSDTDLAFNGTEHVHQLQNLYFALTGEELTIKGGEE
jgi:hypothetical protein